MIGRLVVLCLALTTLSFAEGSLPRTVIAIYDSKNSPEIADTIIHQCAEMPLNHLGVKLDYVDIQGELPAIQNDPEVLGVIVWAFDWKVKERETLNRFLRWSIRSIKNDKKFVMMGMQPFDSVLSKADVHLVQRFWKELGLKSTIDWDTTTYETRLIFHQPELFDFERSYPEVIPAYHRMVPVSDEFDCWLTAQKFHNTETNACLLGFHPNGAYASDGYAIYRRFDEESTTLAWYINPFEFFERAFQLSGTPRLDTTTENGRRIFYSHVDGDGWNSISEIYDYRKERAISAEVLLKEIFEPYPHVPVTIAPIAADIDHTWYGKEESVSALKEMVKLPHVKLGTHTFSHPFDWAFFKDYKPSDEYPYLHLYPKGNWLGGGLVAWVKVRLTGLDNTIGEEETEGYDPSNIKVFSEEYTVPRAYALKPFDLNMEVSGAIDITEEIVDHKLPVTIYQWSGDCRPFLAAMEKVAAADIPNLNGGDTRFDSKFNSYAWVKPLGRQVKNYWQIYSSNSNENTYTDYWRDNFHAFNMLPETLENTEEPIRVKPVNLYYHVFSAEKLPGLNALRQNLEYISAQELIPMHAEEFCFIAEGFYSAKLIVEEGIWKVQNRKGCQTVRFDKGASLSVDFSKSKGVIGQRHTQGSLYIFFDPAESAPQFALQKIDTYHVEPSESVFYLCSSSWKVSQLKQDENQATFQAKGFGPLEMHWNVPKEGKYTITSGDSKPVTVQSENQKVLFSAPFPSGQEVLVKLLVEGDRS